jgi:hypothetical protein
MATGKSYNFPGKFYWESPTISLGNFTAGKFYWGNFTGEILLGKFYCWEIFNSSS